MEEAWSLRWLWLARGDRDSRPWASLSAPSHAGELRRSPCQTAETVVSVVTVRCSNRCCRLRLPSMPAQETFLLQSRLRHICRAQERRDEIAPAIDASECAHQ